MTASGTGLLQVGKLDAAKSGRTFTRTLFSHFESMSCKEGIARKVGTTRSRADAEAHVAAANRAILRLLVKQEWRGFVMVGA
jgi:hypothetical protein